MICSLEGSRRFLCGELGQVPTSSRRASETATAGANPGSAILLQVGPRGDTTQQGCQEREVSLGLELRRCLGRDFLPRQLPDKDSGLTGWPESANAAAIVFREELGVGGGRPLSASELLFC